MTSAHAESALQLLGSRLPTGSVIDSWGLTSGRFEAAAYVLEGTTETQFRAFAAKLLPVSVVGTVSLEDDRGYMLYDAQVLETELAGKTHPTPPPRASEWTETRT